MVSRTPNPKIGAGLLVPFCAQHNQYRRTWTPAYWVHKNFNGYYYFGGANASRGMHGSVVTFGIYIYPRAFFRALRRRQYLDLCCLSSPEAHLYNQHPKKPVASHVTQSINRRARASGCSVPVAFDWNALN